LDESRNPFQNLDNEHLSVETKCRLVCFNWNWIQETYFWSFAFNDDDYDRSIFFLQHRNWKIVEKFIIVNTSSCSHQSTYIHLPFVITLKLKGEKSIMIASVLDWVVFTFTSDDFIKNQKKEFGVLLNSSSWLVELTIVISLSFIHCSSRCTTWNGTGRKIVELISQKNTAL
jgi:hypothetical protein